MSEIKDDSDTKEAALKWIALAVLHGINNNAEEICIASTASGGVKVTAEYRTTELPSPGSEIGEQIIEAVRHITHIDRARGESTLAFGIRNNSTDLNIASIQEGDDKKIMISFP